MLTKIYFKDNPDEPVEMFEIDANAAVAQHPNEWSLKPWTSKKVSKADAAAEADAKAKPDAEAAAAKAVADAKAKPDADAAASGGNQQQS